MKVSLFGLFGLIVLTSSVSADDQAKKGQEPVTFTEQIAPIVFQNCTSCHRTDGGAPFNLTNYREVKKRARLIAKVTESQYMPPWPPAKGWGHFQDERRLTESQIGLIEQWAQTGMTEGPPEKLPPLPKFAEGGWKLGKPDLVVTLPEAFEVPADGKDIYRMFVLPLNLPEDQWVTALEIRPTARTAVHHALYFLDNTGASRKLDAADPGPGFGRMGFPRTGTLGGWAVGATPRHLPSGLAYPLTKGSDLVVQIHFHPSGKAEREQPSFGLHFAKAPPKKKLLGTQAPLAFGIGTELRTRGIAPGEKNFTIHGRWEVPFDIDVVLVGGHAHYLCKSMNAVADLPDGREVKLFAIDDWDFNWQGRYNYAEPVRLPKGAVVRTTLSYDNSSDNPRNPSNPPIHVKWGEGSTDEMGAIGLAFVAANENDLASYRGPATFFGGNPAGGRPAALSGLLRGALGGAGTARLNLSLEQLRARFEARDLNKNGKLEGDEIPERLRPYVDRIDANADGALDREELRNLIRALAPQQGGDEPSSSPSTSSKTPNAAEPVTSSPPSETAVTDLDGRTWDPFHRSQGTKATVLMFVTRDCPVANHYAPEIQRICLDYKAVSVNFLLVHVDPSTTPELARAHAKEYGLDVPIVLDRSHTLVRRTGAEVTPEAAVVTPDGQVVYCGRIDDRFGKLGRQRPEPTNRELRAALDAVLAGQPVATARVDAIGCPIEDLK